MAKNHPAAAPAAIAKLIAVFVDDGEHAQHQAIAILRTLGTPAFEQLLITAKSPKPSIRRWAVEAIGGFSDRRAFPALRSAAADTHTSVRHHAIHGLRVRRHPRSAEVLIPLLRDEGGGVRVNAVMALVDLGARSAGPALLAAAGDGKWYVRQHVAHALGVLRVAGARPVLRRLVADPRKAVRDAAQESLALLGDGRQR